MGWRDRKRQFLQNVDLTENTVNLQMLVKERPLRRCRTQEGRTLSLVAVCHVMVTNYDVSSRLLAASGCSASVSGRGLCVRRRGGGVSHASHTVSDAFLSSLAAYNVQGEALRTRIGELPSRGYRICEKGPGVHSVFKRADGGTYLP
jgi:hypothetical protein